MSLKGIDNWTDEQLRDYLHEVDDLDDDASSFEASFIDSVAYKYQGPLSDKQRSVAISIIKRYLE